MKKSLESLPTIVVVGPESYDLNYQNELKFSEHTIDEDLKNQAAWFAYYAVLAELAEDVLNDLKLFLDITEAELDDHYRTELLKSGKVTEAQILNKSHLDHRYIEAATKVNVAKKNHGILMAIKTAFMQRKDTLITLASDLRAQLTTNLALRENKANEKI